MAKRNYKQGKKGKLAGSYHSPVSPPEYTPVPSPATEGEPSSGTESIAGLDPSDAVNGCSVCGELPRSHGMRWHRGAGLHHYTVPTDEQRKQRLLLHNHNARTLNAYNSHIQEYVEGTPSTVPDDAKEWIDSSVEGLSHDARILEIGSGFGRDADYMESIGYSVHRTDAAEGFVNLLRKQGHEAEKFDAVNDDYPDNLDLVFADAVLLHFTEEETARTLGRICEALRLDGGRVAFSVKVGEGTEWSSAKLGEPRLFTYWTRDKMAGLLTSTGYSSSQIQEHGSDTATWLHVVAYR